MLELSAGQIDLWFCFYEPLRDHSLLASYQALLSQDELARQMRFRFESDRHRHLVTRALLRTVLSRYVQLPAAEWEFGRTEHGKPTIASGHHAAKNLSFNISHTQGLILLGITVGSALGVDAEHIRARQAPVDIARSFFSRMEVDTLDKLVGEQRHERFFQYWTLKESYLKARGSGLSVPLDQFGFHFTSHEAIALSIDPALQDCASRWKFWQFKPSVDHLVAVCASRAPQVQQQLVGRRVIPLVQEELFELSILASS